MKSAIAAGIVMLGDIIMLAGLFGSSVAIVTTSLLIATRPAGS